MKLIRHGASGCEKPGAIDSQGQARDLSDLVPDFTPEWMAPGRLAALAAVDLQRLPLVAQGSRLGPPVAGTRQFVAIGLNYRRHAEESGLDIPKEPVVFHKALSS
ncbi:ureidoglycolate lyase, partial [Klebsiella variicola]